jgi:YidC/Oxa1 family membrane protein insertase
MQDQGKRLLLAVALALGFMMIWQTVCKPKEPDQQQQAQQQAAQQAQTHNVPSTSQVGAGAEPGAKRGAEQTIVLPFENLVATFSNYGGDLSSWKLTDKRYEHDVTKGELLPDPKTHPDTGAFVVNFDRGSSIVLPSHAEWQGQKLSDTEVQYTLSTPQLDVVKKFTVVPDAYMVKLQVRVSVKDGEAHQALAISTYEFQDPKQTSSGSARVQPRQWDSATRTAGGDNLSTPVTSILDPTGGPRYEPAIQWTGFEHPYLLLAMAPRPDGGAVAKHTYADANGLMQTDMVYPNEAINNKVALQREVVGYLGPKNYDQLDHTDAVAGYPTGFNTVIDLGWFSFIGKPLLWLLLKFHSVFGNWGIAIVLLTLLVKAATLYWTTKSMRSMKAMAVLGPQMKELQAKYKDDKQRLQLETMALYKQNGVNPLAGCLPILLQMPIWLALYRMLSSAGELYQQPFIGGWIDDLTASDPFYILPIVLVVTMFLQARLTPTTVDPSQRMQQRMMQYGMPLMFGAMSFFFPAGLSLYIFTNTCLSALHSIYMNKYDKKSVALAAKLKKNQAAAAAAKEAAAVKGAKDANAKDDKVSDVEQARSKKTEPDGERADRQLEAKPRVRTSQRRKKGGRR